MAAAVAWNGSVRASSTGRPQRPNDRRQVSRAAGAAPDLRYERDGPRGRWVSAPGAFAPWTIDAGAFQLELRPTTSGEVGCYPEHAAAWAVVAAAVASGRGRVLNLFAHTGGTTLAAASAGGAVAHVDAVRTAVTWARRNVELSGLAGAPVRWIIDDAAAFAAREARRGRAYDVVVADPPAYGHGTGAHRWHLAADLPPLLASCRALGEGGDPPMLVLTSHSRRCRQATSPTSCARPGMARAPAASR